VEIRHCAALECEFGGAFQYLSEELRGGRGVVLEALRRDWETLGFASVQYRSDR
jgi:hypothetical protein